MAFSELRQAEPQIVRTMVPREDWQALRIMLAIAV